MSKASKKQEAAVLSAKVERLVAQHAAGNVNAGNEAFAIADKLTKELTAATSFNELLDGANHGYRPTLRGDVDPRANVLADLYDYAQARRGVDVVAYRG
jgi:hypothetical protein